MRTIMDKAEAMRHKACIPQSWWEFSVLHALHIYNRTPLHRHKWRTPYTVLNSSLHGWCIWPLFAFFCFLLLSSKEFHMSRSVSRPSFTFEILLCNGSNALVSVTVSHRPHVVPFTSTITATR